MRLAGGASRQNADEIFEEEGGINTPGAVLLFARLPLRFCRAICHAPVPALWCAARPPWVAITGQVFQNWVEIGW